MYYLCYSFCGQYFACILHKGASIFYVDGLGGRGGFQKIYIFLQGGGGGGFRKYLHRHLTSLLFSKVRIFKQNFIANENFFQEKYIFFQFFSIHFIFAAAIKTFFCLARGEGPSNVYVVFMGGSSKCLRLSTRGEGGSKMAEILST